MADSTLWGIGAIVAIVLLTGLFLYGGPQAPSTNIAGQATQPGLIEPGSDGTCEPSRFCDGTKLVIIQSDCSIGTAFCQSGCNKEQLVCN